MMKSRFFCIIAILSEGILKSFKYLPKYPKIKDFEKQRGITKRIKTISIIAGFNLKKIGSLSKIEIPPIELIRIRSKSTKKSGFL